MEVVNLVRKARYARAAFPANATVVTLDGGHAERKNVRLGLITDQSVEVTSGLADGQIVAIANASGLNNGDAVAPQLRTALASTGVE